MTVEELNAQVYMKMFSEQEQFKGWLLSQPPEEILNHAYEYTVREDILLAMEYHDVSSEQAEALRSSETPLADIYKDFEQIEGDHMDVIRGCIETRANDIIEAQRLALLQLPVYNETASYAREHGELEAYRSSLRANTMCRDAIEDAIAENYSNNRLNTKGASDILARFGAERTMYVLAATIQDKDWDGRISDKNKAWAKGISIAVENTAWGTKNSRQFVANKSHPGLIDIFATQVRFEIGEKTTQRPSVLKKLQETAPSPSKKKTAQKERGDER